LAMRAVGGSYGSGRLAACREGSRAGDGIGREHSGQREARPAPDGGKRGLGVSGVGGGGTDVGLGS
jgi:hypothetical protein